MKKNILVISMLVLIIILTSCSIPKMDYSNKIIAPKNNILPIEGKWLVEKVIDSPNKKIKENREGEKLYKEILFHNQAVVVGKQYILDPSYNIKNIKLSDYLLYKFKIETNYLGIQDGEAEVIRVIGNNQCFYEFIIYEEDKIILSLEEQFFFLKRKTKQVKEEEIKKHINVEKQKSEDLDMYKIESLNTGILLGIKTYSYDEINKLDDWEYKTIWMKINNREISSVYEIDKLLLPRKKGFCLLDIEREKNKKTIEDKIKFVPEAIKNKENELKNIEKSNEVVVLKNILYLGNDYISIELIDKNTNRKTLELYPLDKKDKGPSTRLSDIINNLDIELDYNNFGLFRRNGYWIMKGRENYKKENKEFYKDYIIKTIPPEEIVGYDNLSIPWTRIKEEFPNAKDAYISPSEDIIIIETKKDISVYPIVNNEILKENLGKIKKSNNDTIIMAEWSTDVYTSLWEKEVLKNNSKKINYK